MTEQFDLTKVTEKFEQFYRVLHKKAIQGRKGIF